MPCIHAPHMAGHTAYLTPVHSQVAFDAMGCSTDVDEEAALAACQIWPNAVLLADGQADSLKQPLQDVESSEVVEQPAEGAPNGGGSKSRNRRGS